MDAKNAFLCLDCNSYVRDFLRFKTKTRDVSEMFQDLERLLADAKVDTHLQIACNLRQACNLPVPEIQFVESPNEDDFASIEQFALDESVEVENCDIEYLMESDEFLQETDTEFEVATKQEYEFSLDESVEQYEDDCNISDSEQVIDEYLSVDSNEYNFQGNEDDDFKEKSEEDVSDDVSKHFT